MLRKIAVMLTAATVLGLAAPASAQVVYGGGWWGWSLSPPLLQLLSTASLLCRAATSL